MSILSDIESGISKAAQFLVNIFTKTSAVIAVLQKISTPTLAAMLAVFHDIMGFVQEGGDVATLFSTGNVAGAIGAILSTTTQTLLANLVTDLKAGEQTIVSDLNQLGIAIKATAATSSTPPATS